MSSRSLGQLTIDLLIKTGQFERDVRGVKTTTEKLTNMAARSFTRLAQATTLAMSAMGAAFAYQVKQQINFADEMGKMAARVGVSTESLSTLAFVADQSGTSIEALETGLVRLARNMSDAERGLSTATDAFDALNVVWRDSQGNLRDQETVLKEVADKFSKLADGAEKTAAATMLFGRSGAQLIPMLNQGADGIEKLQARARELGLEISHKTAMEAALFNDTVNTLTSSVTGLARDMARDLLPGLNDIVKAMTEAQREGGILTAIWVGLGGVASKVWDGITGDGSLEQQLSNTQEEIARFQSRIDKEYERYDGKRSRRAELYQQTLVGLLDKEGQLKAAIEAQTEAERQRFEQLKAEEQARIRAQEAEAERLRQQRIAQEEARRLEAEEKMRLKNIDALIEGLQMQADTLGMTSTEMVLYRLRSLQATEADQERAATLAKLIEQYEKQKKAAEDSGKAHNAFADQAARNMQTVVAAFIRGESAGRSFTRMLVNLASEVAAQGLLRRLFGGFAERSGFMGAFASAVMGGRASGGPVSPGLWEVNENGPEVFETGGKAYLMTGNAGTVKNINPKSGDIHLSFSVSADRDPSKDMALAQELVRLFRHEMDLNNRGLVYG